MPTSGHTPHDFVAAPDGSLRFGVISAEVARVIDRPGGEIRLQRGQHAGRDGWGAAHIHAGHADNLGQAGYKYIDDFIVDVANNHTRIFAGNKNRIELFMPAYESKIKKVSLRFNYMLVLEMSASQPFTVWTVITGYEIRRDKKVKGQLLWQRSEPAVSGPSLATPSSGLPASESESVG